VHVSAVGTLVEVPGEVARLPSSRHDGARVAEPCAERREARRENKVFRRPTGNSDFGGD
jgi:hypothetical protein